MVYVLCCTVFEAVAAAGDGDDLGVMQEAVQDGCGAGHVADELATVPDPLPLAAQ